MPIQPDQVVEEEAIDFFLDENLDPDDQMYLMDVIENDDRLSAIFDAVLIKAIEVSKEGHIEGQGSGTSDSIPARLSDGEFVFSAKAVEVLGPENLQRMMENAEKRHSNRASVSDKDLDGVNVDSSVRVDGTDEELKIQEPAADSLNRFDSMISNLENLASSLSGPTNI